MTTGDSWPNYPLPGVYEHYKGGRYLVLGLARDDADDTPLVVYVRLYSRPGHPMTVRTVADFTATVTTPDGERPRFQRLGGDEPG